MATTTYAGRPVTLDDEGFFTDPGQWSEDMIPELAASAGLDRLTDRHREVIAFVRARYTAQGAAPAVRALSKSSGVPVKELYQLFPKGPAKTAARIAGVPKPRGCI
ncbi:TusE/DsrC/DsvC family sulfur relay protein [Actinomadura sp. ATCC 31491]|uniref:TusE/DsrC/DsvC family sulfur relay protein n=1 Tax=Actinomadura luzonensis TaxID=2805427 RepID=A0ABT0FX91_9ACTN|nr:TusE/DsrC/DsvC family sulfur relay protein [Actinomadura luzonensis]MCK2216956.1 TusE/DsrC/DsvC family sulfur relay protein [Actinomadura luzonensis]